MWSLVLLNWSKNISEVYVEKSIFATELNLNLTIIMKRTVLFALFSAFCMVLPAQNLKQDFQNPPQEARPRVWWHWMNGNITQDGIRKDLNWMKNSGIAGFHNFDAGLSTPQIVEKRLEYMTPEWKEAFRLTTHLADSLGLEMTIASAPGWSATGGPWVTPEEAMKKLSFSKMQITGGSKKPVTYTIPAAMKATGFFQNSPASDTASSFSGVESKPNEYYKDIAVIAVKLPEADKTLQQMGAVVSVNSGTATIESLTDGDLSTGAFVGCDDNAGFGYIQYAFPQPQTIKSLSVVMGRTRGEWEGNDPAAVNSLWASNDGEHFYEVCKIPDGSVAQQTIDIPATTAKYFRLRVENPLPSGGYAALFGVQGEIPKGTDIQEFQLFGVNKINHSEEKTGWAATWDLEHFPTPSVPKEEAIAKSDVLDLTNLLDADGKFTYKFPAGEWRIYRLGYSLTGKQNHPASPEATGLEVDKMDPDAWHRYFKAYFDMYKEASGGMMGAKGIQYVLTDSYEAGSMTWTPRMLEQFEKRRGYSMLPWMPVLVGEIVGSAEESEAFLWDWRKTCSELIAEGFDKISEIAKNEYGMKGRYTEAHENGRLFLVDGMDVKRTAEIPMSAIWWPTPGAGSALPMALADIRESASVAHIFGQNLVAAESMTAMGMGNNTAWSFYPGKLKFLADQEFAAGLNRIVVHTSPHQPTDTHKPGLGLMIFGQWFDRHETWADYAKNWTDYLSRSSYMLQQGKYVADVLYYYGEDNNITGLFGHKLPAIPVGYSFDFCNPTALLDEVSAQDGKLVTRSGMQYSVLVLDKNTKRMSVPVLRKIAKLAKAGIPIYGAKPEFKASLNDDPVEWQNLADEIWSRANVTVPANFNSLQDILQGAGVQPDFQIADKGLEMPFVHRHLADKEIYWVKNPTLQALKVDATFRVAGKKPQIYHPEDGRVEDCSYVIKDGKTVVTLNLVSEDAVFVVFEGTAAENKVQLAEAEEHTMQVVDGPWEVAFEEGRGAPKTATFTELSDFSENENEGIKYFSGKATYTKTIVVDKKQLASAGQVLLDLGKVCVMAEVFVNGQNMGVAWKAPFKLDITSALKPGKNDLKIIVTNLWVNRLIGDAQPGVEKKITYTSLPFYQANAPLQPSGMMGPVKLIGK